MPIEIKELNIKVSLSDNNSGDTGNNAAPTVASPSSNGSANAAALIDEVVEKVLEILKQRNER